MANHFWVYPTKRQNEFYDIKKYLSLLKKEFPEFIFKCESYLTGSLGEGNPKENYFKISAYDKDGEKYFFTLELYSKFPYIDDSENKMELIDNLDKKDEDIADITLRDLEDNGELKCIEARRTIYHREMSLITRWMQKYFQAFVMDDGIYPEIIFPLPENEDYRPKKEKSLIKKFGDWISKKNEI